MATTAAFDDGREATTTVRRETTLGQKVVAIMTEFMETTTPARAGH